MSPFRLRFHRLALVAIAVIAIAPVARPSSTVGASSFAVYRLSTPPQRAQGDFDGDGRLDTAVIQERDGGNRLSIQLSTSNSFVELETAVTGVVQGDIDHDGDLDLVAATSSGELVILLNDGHGRFTRKPTSSTGALSGQPTFGVAAIDEGALVTWTSTTRSFVRAERIATLADRLLFSAGSVVEISGSVIPPPLRAPPHPAA